MAGNPELPIITKIVHQKDGRAATEFSADLDAILKGGNQKLADFAKQSQQTLANALAIPRNTAGSLDLGVPQMREAAQAQQLQATAARELYQAKLRLVQASTSVTQADRLEIAALKEQARANQLDADAINARVRALDALQSELNQQKSAVTGVISATREGTTANHMMVNSQKSARHSTIQMGQQMQDIAISLQGGQRASTVFAQQLPQLAFALSGAGGKVGAVATALSGPLSLALVAAGAALGYLVDKFIIGGKEADKAKNTFVDLTSATARQTAAKRDLIAAIDDYNDGQAKANENSRLSIQLALTAADAEFRKAIAIRESLKAQREQIDADAAKARGGDPTSALFVNKGRYGRVGGIESENDAAIARLQKEITNRTIDLGRIAAETQDPLEAIRRKYQDIATAAERIARANRGLVNGTPIAATLIEIERRQRAEEAALKVENRSSTLPKVNGREVARLLGTIPNGGGDGTRTVSQNAAAGGAANSYHLSGQAIDIPLTVNGRRLTKESIRAALEPAGIVIKELLGPGDKNHSDHFHIAFAKARRGADEVAEAAGRIDSELRRAADEAIRLAEFGREAGVSIIAMNDRFSDTPQAVLASRAALEQINDLIGQLGDKEPAGFKDMQRRLEALKPAAEALANGPFNDMLQSADERRQIDELILAGHRDDAEVLARQFGVLRENKELTGEQLADVRALVVAERLRSRELEKQSEAQQRQLQLIASTKGNIANTVYDLFKGGGLSAIGDGLSRQWDAMLQNMAENLTDDIFGEFFRDRKDEIFEGVKESSDAAAPAINRLGDAAAATAAALENSFDQTFGKSAGAANDNAPGGAPGSVAEIVVVGQKSAARAIKDALNVGLQGILGKQLYDQIGAAVPTALQGAAFGQIGGGLVGRPGIGSAVGGVLGQEAGKAIGKGVSGALGTALGPIGGIIGGVLGGLLGGLRAKTGSASVSSGGIVQGGNNAAAQAAASSAGSAAQSSIAKIAEALGGSVGDYGFTIGQRNDEFRVSGSTGADVTSKNPKGDILYKGKDQAEALRVALVNAIEDGAVKGIREGAKRLLLAGKDLDAQLAKAIKFQNVFDELDAIKDPLGSAVRKLNREFESLIGIFKEAGATTEEYASLEELYGLKRADVIKQQTEATKQANEAMVSSLKDLIAQLEVGDSGLSLRDRLSNATAIYNPLADTIRGGGSVDYDKFTAAARDVIDITRQIYGSQEEYFRTFNDVLGLSKQALAKEGSKAVSISTDGLAGSPFSSFSAANDNSSLTAALNNLGLSIAGGASLADLQAQLNALNNNIGTLIQIGLSNGTIAPATNFAVNSYF